MVKLSIWKFDLTMADSQIVWMPTNARILTVQMQRGIPCVWAVVDEYEETEPRVIRIFGTGNPYDANAAHYIGTVQNGPLVWHVFEEQP